jgi:hypothetical protein
VPNAFPWRKCLHEYEGLATTHDCDFDPLGLEKQSLVLTPLPGSSEFQLQLAADRQCLEGEAGAAVFRACSPAGRWGWSRDGLLEWSGGGCLASTGGQVPAVLVPCNNTFDDQIVEVGVVRPADGAAETELVPFDLELWRERAEARRASELELAGAEVAHVLQEVGQLNQSGSLGRVEGTRRAVVFYVDRGSGFLDSLRWWLFTWQAIELDSARAAFDIVLMVHPASVALLPAACQPPPPGWEPRAPGPGRCLWRELVPLSERDHRYDSYLNSQECLFNPAAAFLQHYRLLLRADLDTFPTPAMVNYWPKDMICNKNAGTTHYRPDIERAIVETARAAGIEHQHWHNTDSSWLGPAARVVALAKLTTSLARFTRAHMFGPGTACRCAACSSLPRECEWGQGIYAGTLLLYAQEIAMNQLWTQAEYNSQTSAVLDGSCTDASIHVCTTALLHARHNSDPFSKIAFHDGQYKDFDMSELNITNVRDYSMYMALLSKKEGKGGSGAWATYMEQHPPLVDLCIDQI